MDELGTHVIVVQITKQNLLLCVKSFKHYFVSKQNYIYKNIIYLFMHMTFSTYQQET